MFGGLSIEAVARTLGVAESTISEDWRFARVWLARELPGGAFVVQEKVDGSLILLFSYGGEWVVASRGSFTLVTRALAKPRANFKPVPGYCTTSYEGTSPNIR